MEQESEKEGEDVNVKEENENKKMDLYDKKFDDKMTRYKIIKLYETKNGELFFVLSTENKNEETNKYILNKIELKTKNKKQIKNNINILQKINCKYIIKIIEYFIVHEEGKEMMWIIMNYYQNNVSKIIYQTNYLNQRNVWKIFYSNYFWIK